MISQARLEANRRNARKSTGPRTAAGKAAASRNAYRHGLAAISRNRPALFPEIARMAKALGGNDANPFLFEQALIIAENHLVLQCVRAERAAVIDRLRNPTAQPLATDDSMARAKARFAAGKNQYQRLVDQAKQAVSVGSDAKRMQQEREAAARETFPRKSPRPPPAPEALDELAAMERAAPDLIRLDRYERRAWSRRSRAIERFTHIKSTDTNQ